LQQIFRPTNRGSIKRLIERRYIVPPSRNPAAPWRLLGSLGLPRDRGEEFRELSRCLQAIDVPGAPNLVLP